MLGLVVGAIMCYLNIQASVVSSSTNAMYTLFQGSMFEAPIYIDFFGIPLISIDYTGTVIPELI